MAERLQVALWRAAGKEPYAYSFQRTHKAAELQKLYADLPAGEVRQGMRASASLRGAVL